MPADIVGSMVMETDSSGAKSLRFQPGRSSLTRAGRRNQPRTPKPVGAARSDAGADGHLGTTTHELDRRSWSWRRRIRSRWRAPIRCRGPTRSLSDEDRRRVSVARRAQRIVERTIQRDEPNSARSSRAARSSSCATPVASDRRAACAGFRVSLVMATQPAPTAPIRWPISTSAMVHRPRSQALVECGRVYALMNGAIISPATTSARSRPRLAPRIILNFDAHATARPRTLLRELISAVSARQPKP